VRFLNHKVTKLVALGIVLGVILSYLLILLPWLPAQDSKQSVRTDRLTEAITYVSGAIFGLVIIKMFYCVWKFRRPTTCATARRSTGTPASRSSGRRSRS
jgi:heme/copper-type cytochrome/quinol oxidase subunit 2